MQEQLHRTTEKLPLTAQNISPFPSPLHQAACRRSSASPRCKSPPLSQFPPRQSLLHHSHSLSHQQDHFKDSCRPTSWILLWSLPLAELFRMLCPRRLTRARPARWLNKVLVSAPSCRCPQPSALSVFQARMKSDVQK